MFYRMSEVSEPPIFSVRQHDDKPSYVIDITWADGATEQLHGLFVSREAAERWIDTESTSAVEQLLR